MKRGFILVPLFLTGLPDPVFAGASSQTFAPANSGSRSTARPASSHAPPDGAG
jgi:hypothetical protein